MTTAETVYHCKKSYAIDAACYANDNCADGSKASDPTCGPASTPGAGKCGFHNITSGGDCSNAGHYCKDVCSTTSKIGTLVPVKKCRETLAAVDENCVNDDNCATGTTCKYENDGEWVAISAAHSDGKCKA